MEKDRINHLDLRVTPGVGVGYQWIETPDFNFNTEGGVAWVYEKYSNLSDPNENVSLRFAYHVDKTILNERLKLFNDVTYLPSVENENNYLILGVAGLHYDFTKSFFSELKAQVNYDNRPAPLSHRTTAQYILGVGWMF